MADKKDVNDVVRANNVLTSATSRPIVTSQDSVQDPMVNPDMESDANKVGLAPPSSKKVISPISEQSVEPDSQEVNKKQGKSQIEGEETATVDAVLGSKADNKQKEEDERREKELQDIADKLVSEGKYFLPINQVKKRRNNRIAIVLLLLLMLIGAGLWFANSQGVISIDKLIQNSNTPSPPVASNPPQQSKKADPPPLATKEFIDNKLGFKFNYPAEWGNAQVSDQKINQTERGKRITITFDKKSDINIGLKSPDWGIDALTIVNRDLCRIFGEDITYEPDATDFKKGIRSVWQSDNKQVVQAVDTLCSQGELLGRVGFVTNTQFTGLLLDKRYVFDSSLTRDELLRKLREDSTKIFPQKDVDQVKALIISVKEI